MDASPIVLIFSSPKRSESASTSENRPFSQAAVSSGAREAVSGVKSTIVREQYGGLREPVGDGLGKDVQQQTLRAGLPILPACGSPPISVAPSGERNAQSMTPLEFTNPPSDHCRRKGSRSIVVS